MPIVNSRGEVLNENDLKALENMLRGSLENHRDRAQQTEDLGLDEDLFDPSINAFNDAAGGLAKAIKKAAKSKKTVSVDDFINQTFGNVFEKIRKKTDFASDDAGEYLNMCAIQWGEPNLVRKVVNNPEYEPDYKDTPQAYQNTVEDFKFADEPFKGIEEIETVDIENGSFASLEEGRAGSSSTLAADLDELRKAVENAPENSQERKNAQKELEKTEKAKMGHHMGCEMSRMYADDLKDKKQVSFGDVYNAFASLNEAARPGDKDAGKLRGKYVAVPNRLEGVGSVYVPGQLYKTMDIIAQGINRIKSESDNPSLQKTHAIQLASFASQMLISQHVFNDANGRTCRMFADTILQTFGLPPHIPPKEVDPKLEPKNSFGTIGTKLAFDWGANYIFDGVKRSNAVLQETKQKEAERKSEQVKEISFNTFSANLQNKGQQVRNDDNIIIRNDSNQLNRINIMDDPKPVRRQPAARPLDVTDETCKYLQAMHEYASEARGFFSDSPEYLAFHKALVDTEMMAKEIYGHRRDPKYDKNAAMREYTAQVNHLKDCAKAYEDYKLSDHTENPQAEPEKKRLNSDDRRKLDIVRNITNPKNVHLGPAQNVKKSGKENIM